MKRFLNMIPNYFFSIATDPYGFGSAALLTLLYICIRLDEFGGRLHNS
jgi:hypothetical protein